MLYSIKDPLLRQKVHLKNSIIFSLFNIEKHCHNASFIIGILYYIVHYWSNV